MLNFNTSPYYDDYNRPDRYYRILFRPGFAVQARELTQIQSILQNQISRLGDHLFQDGSVVSNGQFTSVECFFARVNPTIEVADIGNNVWSEVASGTDTTEALSNIRDNEFISGSGIRGRVVASDGASLSSDNFHAIAFNYLTDNRVSPVSGGITLVVEVATLGLKYRLTVASSGTVTGKAFVITSQEGIYYIDGFFVLADPQRILLYDVVSGVRQFATPTRRVGFTVSDEIITILDDASLGDPAFGSPNQNAPGADRFRKTLTISQKDLAASTAISATNSPDFIEVLRYENGVVTKRNEFPAYAVLGETLARRTFDESGNYTVDPFDIQVREHTDVFGVGGSSGQLAIGLEPGKAYVRGYEFENIATKFVTIDKARDTDTASGEETNFTMGRYVIIGATSGIANGITGGASVLNTENHPLVSLQTVAGVTTATARFRQISFNAADQFRVYLYDVKNISGQTFGDSAWVVGAGGTIGWISETAGKTANQTNLFESTRDSLIVPLPREEATKTVTGLNHEYQISISATGIGNNVTFPIPGSSGDPVEFKGTLGTVDPSLLGRDYFLINASTGDFFDDFTGITVSLNNSTECEVEFSTSVNGNGFVLIANADVDNDKITAPYFASKTLAAITNATLAITYADDIGATVALFDRPDVYSVQSILGDSTGQDYTNRWILDDGQRDNFYDHSRLILKAGATLGADTNVSVNCLAFTRSGNGPFTVDSYPIGTLIQGSTFGYENIPSFTSEKTGKTYSLRDVVDFRPQRQAGGTTFVGQIPNAAISIEADYEHYLPRIDKVVLGSDQQFRVVSGVPSLNPQIPNENPDDMVLYILRLGSYTFGVDDVEVRYVDNKRFTMRDLGRLEDRVDQLEFYSSLSFLEQEANGRTFLDSNGDVIPKTGILVDNFNGHQIGNVTNPDYLCSMDFEQGELRPSFVSRNIQVAKRTTTDSTIVGITVAAEKILVGSPNTKNQLFMLAHTSERVLGNTAYNTEISVNPTNRVDWLGHLYISPESDNWFSKDSRPVVKVNKQGANDAYLFRRGVGDGKFGFGTQWLDWETNWFGVQKLNKEINRESELLKTRRVFDDTFTPESSDENIRDVDTDAITVQQLAGLSVSSRGRGAIARKVIPDTIFKTINDRIVNSAIQPFSQDKNVRVKAVGLKPNTDVFLFVDSDQGGSYETGSDGSVEFEFSMPTVRTGPRVVRLIDSPTNDISEASTIAETIFRASGLFDTSSTKSTRSPIVRRASVSDDTVLTDYLSRNTVSASAPRSITALSQQFTVDRVRYQNGFFLKSVDLWFSEVPAEESSAVPVIVEIRPMQSGYPHPSRIIPGSVAVKGGPSISTSGSTNFEFEYPVYLEPGEYAITVRANSNEYTLRAGNIGLPADNASSTTNPENVSAQPFVGPLFRPQNAGIIESDKTTVIAFSLNRCKFNTSGGTLVVGNDLSESNFSYDLFRVNASYLDPSQTGLSWNIRTANDSSGSLNSSRRIVPNETLGPPASQNRQNIISGSDTLQISIALTTTDDAISPIVDGERLSFLAIQNDIRTTSSENPSLSGELSPQISDSTASTADISKSRYITKTIVLEDGMDSTDLRVFANICQPGSSVVQVYAKTLPVDESGEFDEQNWVQLTPQTVFNSLNNTDFREVEFKPTTVNKALLGSFRVFAIKVVMHVKNGRDIPRIRDLRVISLA